MANQHRRTKRLIREQVKKLKSGEIPMPPEPRKVSPAEEADILKQLEEVRDRIDPTLEQIKDVDSRQAAKTRIRLEQDRERLNDVLGPKKKKHKKKKQLTKKRTKKH